MLEADRKYRNAMKLAELYPTFRTQVEGVIKEMESFGYRPRIQEAWRSEQAQMEAFTKGTSKVKFGFHNVVGANGAKEALAADLIDDNNPTGRTTDFILHLAAAAENHGVTPGIRWDLPDDDSVLIDIALMNKNWQAKLRLGFDPMHVEVTGLTIPEAKAGGRPDKHVANVPEEEKEAEKEPEEPWGIHYRVENLSTNEVKEYELGSALKPVWLLPVPYVSQLASDADDHVKDCGPACAVMLLRAYLGTVMSPDDFYVRFNIKGDPFLAASQMRSSLRSLGIGTDWRVGLSLGDLFAVLAESKPMITLIRYGVLRDAGLTERNFDGPHYCVVVGIDAKYVYVHDPLYANPTDGEARAYPLSVFFKAWREVGTDPKIPNPSQAAIIPTAGLGVPYKRRVRVMISTLNIRSAPGMSNPIVGTLKLNEVVEIASELSGWGEIAGRGWIFLTYTALVK